MRSIKLICALCIISLQIKICGHGIMAITSAFQADDAGSIPAARSINIGECYGRNKPSY